MNKWAESTASSDRRTEPNKTIFYLLFGGSITGKVAVASDFLCCTVLAARCAVAEIISDTLLSTSVKSQLIGVAAIWKKKKKKIIKTYMVEGASL